MRMLTEDEAKTRWCPFAREAIQAGSSAAATANRHLGRALCTCLASGCMAWRDAAPAPNGALRGYCGIVGVGAP